MSLTSKYFKSHPISATKLTKKKVNRAKKKCTVLNCDGACEDFINRWKHFLQPK